MLTEEIGTSNVCPLFKSGVGRCGDSSYGVWASPHGTALLFSVRPGSTGASQNFEPQPPRSKHSPPPRRRLHGAAKWNGRSHARSQYTPIIGGEETSERELSGEKLGIIIWHRLNNGRFEERSSRKPTSHFGRLLVDYNTCRLCRLFVVLWIAVQAWQDTLEFPRCLFFGDIGLLEKMSLDPTPLLA